MSKQPVEAQMRRFLASSEPEAMCVTGAWGVGKTFLWGQALNAAKNYKGIKLDAYSYVSLFGISDLDQLKQAIFENRMPADQIGEPITATTIEQNFRRFSAPLLKIVGEVPIIGMVAKNAAPLLSMSISEQIVCIDDLERRGASLSIRDVLGLVTFLKEQRRCQVLVLTNDTDLQGGDKAEYEQLQEKVFDRVMAFAPSAEYCADIALTGEDVPLRPDVIKLGISNIRVINKIRQFMRDVRPLISSLHPSLLEQAAHTLTLACWMTYIKSAPPPSFLSKRIEIMVRHTMGRSSQSSAPVDPQELAWANQIDDYGFGERDEFDLILFDGVRNGYFDEEAVAKAAESLQRDARVAEGEASRRQAWRRFHDSYDDNEKEVVEGFMTAYGQTMSHVSAKGLDHVLALLRSLGRNTDADTLIDRYVEAHRGRAAAFDQRAQREHGEDVVDAKLLDAMRTQQELELGAIDPISALKRLSSGGSRRDYEIAVQVSVDQLVAEFETLRGQELNDFEKTCLELKLQNPYLVDTPSVTRKARLALAHLAKRCKINEIRVRRMGIDLDTPNTSTCE